MMVELGLAGGGPSAQAAQQRARRGTPRAQAEDMRALPDAKRIKAEASGASSLALALLPSSAASSSASAAPSAGSASRPDRVSGSAACFIFGAQPHWQRSAGIGSLHAALQHGPHHRRSSEEDGSHGGAPWQICRVLCVHLFGRSTGALLVSLVRRPPCSHSFVDAAVGLRIRRCACEQITPK